MTFLFDIGRVLLDFDFETSLARLFPAGTPDVHERLQRMLARKDEFEAGRIDVDTFTNWALEVMETDATAEQFHHAWRHIFSPNEPMWRRVRGFSAAGHRLILFSNINAIHSPWIYDEFPEFHLFDAAVMSFQTGFIKPQPEIYRHAIERHGLVPAQTLYIDDLPQNAAAGRAIGFHTWEYDLKDHAAFEDWLASFPI
jgi:putative hydrolase of the HAD superfamily